MTETQFVLIDMAERLDALYRKQERDALSMAERFTMYAERAARGRLDGETSPSSWSTMRDIDEAQGQITALERAFFSLCRAMLGEEATKTVRKAMSGAAA